ncbi:response regulator [Desulfonema magnum]|uniref:Two component system response regulator n=1 Tax=Desulfonema magnum TaxID=45655 RepID=A0A975GQI3_9BACT|nr:response regulator [Desulfonema magnum]QTA90071.1 Two component system response regulator [Desulfonema magnum]
MKHIIVADDDPLIRRLLRSVLEDGGYRVTEASDGKITIKLYRQKPADLVILDLIMPEKEGIETIIELRRDFPNIKIISISGGLMGEAEAFLDAARKLGALRTFKKPLNPFEMLRAVKELTGEKKNRSDI